MMKAILALLTLAGVLACGSGPKDASAAFMPIYTVSGGALSTSCTNSAGTLALSATLSRATGVSPLAVWVDMTGTSDSGVSNAFKDVYYTTTFGDTNSTSGTGTWAYGSLPNTNSMNTATGPVAAHVYVVDDGAGDSTPTITVTAYDGTNTATCQMTLTVYDPSGANGYPTTATTCVYTATLGTGCPTGATQLNTSSFNTALSATYLASGKRVLFKCGDTFTGDNVVIGGSVSNFSIGAYGGCQGTTTSRPIFQATGASALVSTTFGTNATSDGRMSDIDCEGNGNTPDGCFNTLFSGSNLNVAYRITLYNLYSNLMKTNFSWSQGAEMALVRSVQTGMNGGSIGSYVNSSENNPAQWSAGGSHNDMQYQAIIGSHFDGTGHTYTGGGQETVRVSACRMCVFSNSDFENANSIGAVLKIHNGNTNNSVNTWTGIYTEALVISDNLFSGTSGGNLVEVSPQNGGVDERIRAVIVERNLFSPDVGTGAGREIIVSGQDMAVRDNAFNVFNMDWGVQVAQRNNTAAWPTQNIASYNNTCYSTGTGSSKRCVIISNTTQAGTSNITGSPAQNNMAYFTASASSATVQDDFSNTVSNNTVTVTNNPSFTDGSTTLLLMSDWKPTANYTGGTTVPNYYDALGVGWGGTWDLGAVKH